MAHRPHPGSKSRPMQEKEEPDERNDRDGRREDPVDLVVDTEEVNRTLDRRQDAARRWAKGNANAFLKNERQPKGRDDRYRRRVVNGLNHYTLDQRSQDKADQWGDHECKPEVAGGLQRGPSEDGTHHEEVAVGQINDVEQTEDDGEAQRDQCNDQAPNQSV